MTTPAVDVSAYVQAPWVIYYTDRSTGITTVQARGNENFKYTHDYRPRSINMPKSRSNWRNPTSWSREVVRSETDTAGHLTAHVSGNTWSTFVGPLGSIMTMGDVPYPPTWMSNSATSRALLALKGSGENVSVDIAQYGQTVNLFVDTCKKISSGVSAFRKLVNPADWGQILKEGTWATARNIPRQWLELQYGWNPLLADVHGACSDLSSSFERKKSFRKMVQGRVKRSYTSSLTRATGFGGYEKLDMLVKQTVTTKLYYALSSPLWASLSSLGLTNPVDLVWELLRYSFVVDWLLPIGDWLSTLDATFGWTFVGGYSSDWTEVTTVGSVFKQASGDQSGYWFPPKSRAVRYRRTALTGTPGVGVPHFKNPLSGFHIANASALLVEAFAR